MNAASIHGQTSPTTEPHAEPECARAVSGAALSSKVRTWQGQRSGLRWTAGAWGHEEGAEARAWRSVHERTLHRQPSCVAPLARFPRRGGQLLTSLSAPWLTPPPTPHTELQTQTPVPKQTIRQNNPQSSFPHTVRQACVNSGVHCSIPRRFSRVSSSCQCLAKPLRRPSQRRLAGQAWEGASDLPRVALVWAYRKPSG